MSIGDVFVSLRGHVAAIFHRHRRPLNRQSRRLTRENLERRCVLSVAPLEVESDVPALESYIAAEPEIGPVEPAVEDATDAGSVPPEAADPYFSDGVGDGSGGEEGEEENTAPQLVTFDVQLDLEDENYLILSGTVADDGSLESCMVRFGGLIAGSALVASDGSFELRIERPGYSGVITATASDGELFSEIENFYFDLG
jgi:hypothetical protein